MAGNRPDAELINLAHYRHKEDEIWPLYATETDVGMCKFAGAAQSQLNIAILVL